MPRIPSGTLATLLAVTLLAACSDDSTAPAGQSFNAALNAANEITTPDTNSATATGTATFTIRDTVVTFAVTVNGLTGPANGAHIHGPLSANDAQENKGLVVNISSFTTLSTSTSGSLMTGSFGPGKVLAAAGGATFDSLRIWLQNGRTYFNVHTAAHPGGEIRGTIHPVTAATTSTGGY